MSPYPCPRHGEPLAADCLRAIELWDFHRTLHSNIFCKFWSKNLHPAIKFSYQYIKLSFTRWLLALSERNHKRSGKDVEDTLWLCWVSTDYDIKLMVVLQTVVFKMIIPDLWPTWDKMEKFSPLSTARAGPTQARASAPQCSSNQLVHFTWDFASLLYVNEMKWFKMTSIGYYVSLAEVS